MVGEVVTLIHEKNTKEIREDVMVGRVDQVINKVTYSTLLGE